MDVSREQALQAMMLMTDGAKAIAVGIPQHLEEHPELDPETVLLLQSVEVVIPLIVRTLTSTFEQALRLEDLNDEIIRDLRKLNDSMK